jgi:hypothetical protein
MTITYRNGFRDRLAFAAYHLPRKPLIILMTVGILLFFTFESVLPAAHSASADKPMVVRVIAFIFVETLLVLFLVAFWAVITVITMVSTKNKPLYCQRALTVGDEAFVTESEYGRSETKWTLVQKLARTRSHIFMYLSQESAVIIPRRAFESRTQWDTFYDICRRNKDRVV